MRLRGAKSVFFHRSGRDCVQKSMRLVLGYTRVVATSFGEGADSHKTPRRAGSRRSCVTVDGCTSEKSGPLIKSEFFSNAMHEPAFLSMM